ncbi:MAG: DMT family transporter [Janthinobacterium lividum]
MQHVPRYRLDLLMLLAALIWGSAFVVQRWSLGVIGPVFFTGLRFLVGALVISLVRPLLLSKTSLPVAPRATGSQSRLWLAAALLGGLLALAISLQQIGLQYTKIANAGFISSLYVVIVPLVGVLLRQKNRANIWIGALFSVCGMYFLSGQADFGLLRGDIYQLACALIVSAQVLLLSRFAPHHEPLALARAQFIACGVFCLLAALWVEPVNLSQIVDAAPAILYGGALSVGVGYTIQVIAQKRATAARAAVIFSMEGLFAAFFAWAALDENLSPRTLFGCALMLGGLLACQLNFTRGGATHRDQASKTS